MGALWGIDVFLARTERGEVSGEARADYEAGSALLAEGRAADAIDPLRKPKPRKILICYGESRSCTWSPDRRLAPKPSSGLYSTTTWMIPASTATWATRNSR
jgi:hypothetical protein